MRKLGISSTVVALIALVFSMLSFAAPANAASYPYKPPSGFKVTKTSSTAISVSWKSPSSSIKSFSVQASTSSSFSSKKTVIVNNLTAVQIASLKPRTKYYLRVRGRNTSKDLTDWSSVISKTTSAYAFAPPSTPSVSNIRKDSFKLTWGEVPNAAHYRIQLSTKSTFTGSGTPGGTGGAPIYLFTSADNAAYIGRGGTVTVEGTDNKTEDLIKPNTKYYVRVRGLEGKESDGSIYEISDYSGSRSLTTSATWTSYAPSDFKLVSTAKDKIVLSWSDIDTQPQPGQADAYRVQQWTGSSAKRYINIPTPPATGGTTTGSWGSLTRSGATQTLTLNKFCDGTSCSSFTAGAAYYFRVSAQLGSQAVSDYTAASGVKAIASGTPLPSPDNLRVDSVTDKQVTVSWLPVPGATSYRFQQKLSKTNGTTRYLYDLCGNGSSVGLPGPTCTSSGGRLSVTLTKFQDNSTGVSSNMAANQVYYIRVAAQEGTGKLQERASDYNTDYVKAQLKGWPFDPPGNLVTSAHDGSSITMKWDAAPSDHGAVRYRIQYAKNSAMSSAKYATSAVNTNSLRIAGLASETTYYFRIRVVDANDKATYSDYTPIGAPSTARTTSDRGSVTGTLNVPAGCDVDDYRLGAYWGDELVADAEPSAGTNNFRVDLLPVGGAYKLQYAYVGQGNCVSPWVASSATPNSEPHMLKNHATGYPVTANHVTALPATTALVGQVVTGKVTDSAGQALPNVQISAFGASQSGADSYREVHALIFSDTSGNYELNGLWPNEKYKFYFHAPSSLGGSYEDYVLWVNHISSSAPGSPFNVKLTRTGSSPSPGAAPANLRATGSTSASLTLAWNAVSGAPGYRVQISPNSSMSGATYHHFTSTSGTITGLNHGTKYYFRVVVVDANDKDKLSDYTPTPYPSASTS